MEVHHHTHAGHGKKSWKAYFWEFLMLFLAVFCGFFAEYQLEHKIDRDKEQEYIHSMIEDARTDTANIHRAIDFNVARVYKLDSLAMVCFNYGLSEKDDPILNKLYRSCLRHPDFVSPTERTMTQLKNSGGMRLLRNKTAADSILGYDDFAKKLIDQQGWCEEMLRKLVDQCMPIFNFKYSSSLDPVTLKISIPASYDSARLIKNDKALLIELGNRAIMYKNVVLFYLLLLHEGEKHAVNLMQTLRETYHIKVSE